MNDFICTTKVVKNLESTKVLKEASVAFSIFDQSVLELSKSVCRPDEFYMDGDDITFTIRVKNVGTKRVSNFVLINELEDVVKPLVNDSYDVFTTNGLVESFVNPIKIKNVSLDPDKEALITITGVING